jgi:hypothetical protein
VVCLFRCWGSVAVVGRRDVVAAFRKRNSGICLESLSLFFEWSILVYGLVRIWA